MVRKFFLLQSLLALFLFAGCDSHPVENQDQTEDLGHLKIAYNILLDGENDNYEVFVMNPDGSDKKNISNWKGVDWVYYAYGDKIYFISDRDTCHRCYFLYETDTEGASFRKVADIRLNDSWMSTRKNGREMIIRPWSKQDSAFYIINLEGEVLSKIYPDLPYLNDPFFSPDGNQIVFRGSRSKFTRDRTHFDELFLMEADGSGLTQLTEYPAADTSAEWHSYHAGPPFWEPNGNFISYISMQKGNYSLFRINPDGSGLHQITADTLNEGWHAWSPGGDWLVMDVKDKEGNYDIYLADKDGNMINRLTSDTTYEQAPVFVTTGNQ